MAKNSTSREVLCLLLIHAALCLGGLGFLISAFCGQRSSGCKPRRGAPASGRARCHPRGPAGPAGPGGPGGPAGAAGPAATGPGT